MLDPRITNIGVDANALDRTRTARDVLVDRFNALASSWALTVVVAGGVRDEVQHPHTPADTQAAVLPHLYIVRD